VLLHGPADVAQIVAGPALLDCAFQTFLGDAYELEQLLVHAAHRHGRRRVADVAGEGHAAVNGEDVAVAQRVG
jgi:hypothetical protein